MPLLKIGPVGTDEVLSFVLHDNSLACDKRAVGLQLYYFIQ